MSEVNSNKPVKLKNRSCPYCAVALSPENSTVEHVISRKFVPKGFLENQWNIILNACEACNQRKADLEDDLSALTMHPEITGWRGDEHQQLREDAARKAKGSFSRKTGKPIGQSKEQLNMKLAGNGFTMSFGLISGPQIDELRAYDLAVMQAQAVLYWLTYSDRTQVGARWANNNKILRVGSARQSDWGCDRMKAFMVFTRDWDHYFTHETAKGCYRISLRGGPDRSLWSFAVEWNRSYRVVFLVGDEQQLTTALQSLPNPKSRHIQGFDGKTALKVRQEKSLDDLDDSMFT